MFIYHLSSCIILTSLIGLAVWLASSRAIKKDQNVKHSKNKQRSGMLISFERTMRKELWKRIWWMRQGSSKQQPKVSDNWIYSGISRCQIKEHFTALAINAKPTFFDLSLFFRTHWNYFRQKCLVLLLHDCCFAPF